MMETAVHTSTCFIGELPDELLVNIVVHLHIERGFLAQQGAEEQRGWRNAVIVRSLHALTLSCRKFNAIASSFLYQNIIRSSKELFMPLFFRTLLRRPSLSRHIRYFESEKLDDRDIGYFKSDHHHYLERSARVQWPGLQAIPDSQLDAIYGSNATHPVGALEPHNARRHRSVAASSSKALMVLLSMMENLEDAALPDSRTILCALTFTTGRLRQLWLTTGDLSRLRQQYAVRFISAEAEDGRRHLSQYLRRFCILKTDWLELDPPPVLKEISLTVFDVDSVDIDDHLEDCASLKRFSCRWQWTDSFVPQRTVNLPMLRRSLQHICKTLTHLTIDTSESASLVDLDQSIPAFGSLRDYEVLKYLDVAGLVLWGDDDFSELVPLSSILPCSLETLKIKVEWDDDVEDALHELSFDCAACLPNLKRIECNSRPAPRSVAEYLIKAFHMADVDLILVLEDE